MHFPEGLEDSPYNWKLSFTGAGGLKHVTDEQKKAQKKSVDGRDDLLDQIRSGVTLKKVELDNKSEGNSRLVNNTFFNFHLKSDARYIVVKIKCNCDFIVGFLANSDFILQIHHAKALK